jgi:hypothetical protein
VYQWRVCVRQQTLLRIRGGCVVEA